jgi:acyl carrier protein
MHMETDLITLIAKVLREFVGEDGIPSQIAPETPLFGPDGLLDSLGLVSFIVAVEQTIEDVYGVAISLADDKAMSQRQSPYRTIGSLAHYTSQLIQATKVAVNE